MKKIKLFPIILSAILLSAALAPAALASEEAAPAPEIQSAAAVLADGATGRVLYELNGSERRAPASLTKIMTVLLACEALERGEVAAGDMVTAGDEAAEANSHGGSTANIQPGETLSLQDLMYCAMLVSANEACDVIAVHISGSVAAFVDAMNARADELGCTGTHFANANGLDNDEHYTTAADMAIIMREAVSHELFLEISGSASYTVPATNLSAERQLSSTNGLVNPETLVYPGNYYEYARAGKTGDTAKAGLCLASLAERDGVSLVCVVLGGVRVTNQADGSTSFSNFTDTRSLCTWAFGNFGLREVLSTTELVASVRVNLAEDGGQAVLRPREAVSALVPNVGFDPEQLERSVVIYSESDGSELTAPIAAGTVLGEITVSLDGVALGTSSLVTSGTVELARTEFMKQELGNYFGNVWVLGGLALLCALIVLYAVSVVRYRRLHRRHLESVAAARRAEAARAAAESRSPVTRNTAAQQAVRRSTAEMERTTVMSGVSAPRQGGEGVRQPGAHAAPQQRAAAPRQQSHAAPPRTEPRPAQDAGEQRRASAPPAGDKARRDYFEEFFRNNGTNRQGGSHDSSEK